jgi:hypothetical protein
MQKEGARNMLISQAHALQNILLEADALEQAKRPVSVLAVWQQLVKEYGYEYPTDFIMEVLEHRGEYLWNVKTHGYEKHDFDNPPPAASS